MHSSSTMRLLFFVCVVMAILVNTSIYDSSCSKTLVPWTVHCVEDERLTLRGYFKMVVTRSDEKTQAHLPIEKSKDALDIL